MIFPMKKSWCALLTATHTCIIIRNKMLTESYSTYIYCCTFLIIQDHSLPVQVFLGKSGDSSDSSRPPSPCLLQKSFTDNRPAICSTPKANESPASVKLNNCSLDDTDDFSESSCPTGDQHDVHEEISGDTAGSSTEEVNDMGKFSIVEYNINIFLLKIPTKINNCKMQ